MLRCPLSKFFAHSVHSWHCTYVQLWCLAVSESFGNFFLPKSIFLQNVVFIMKMSSDSFLKMAFLVVHIRKKNQSLLTVLSYHLMVKYIGSEVAFVLGYPSLICIMRNLPYLCYYSNKETLHRFVRWVQSHTKYK